MAVVWPTTTPGHAAIHNQQVIDVNPDRFGRFYAPLALAHVALVFLPLFQDVNHNGVTSSYGTIFQMAGTSGGGPAVFGIGVLAAQVMALVKAALQVRGRVLPSVIAGLGAVIAVMLVAKPGTGDPAPALTQSGTAGLALAGCTVVLGLGHVAALTRGRTLA